MDHRASHAERAVRQYRVSAEARLQYRQPNKNGCPIDFLNPWSSTPGGDPPAAIIHPHMVKRSSYPRARTIPDERYGRQRRSDHTRCSRTSTACRSVKGARLAADATYTGNQQRHIWICGYAENPAVYIPGNCVAGQHALTAPVRVRIRARPTGWRAPFCRSSTRSKARNTMSMLRVILPAFRDVSRREGHYNGVRPACRSA